MRVLILGGTPEALAMAKRLYPRVYVVMAYATRPRTPVIWCHHLHVGRFADACTLKQFAHAHKIDLIVDATHPFAAQISLHAHHCPVPSLHVQRPAWPVHARWQNVDRLQNVNSVLPRQGGRVFFAIGRQGYKTARANQNNWTMTRVLEEPAIADVDLCLFGKPGTLSDEIRLLQDHAVTHLVSKNAGGSAGYAKLQAAHALGIQVVLVNRPRCGSIRFYTLAHAISLLVKIPYQPKPHRM